MILAIDPGLRACGVAWFEKGILIKADLVSVKTMESDAKAFLEMANAVGAASPPVTHLAIEYPQQYSRAITPRESVQKLVGVIGALAVTFSDSKTEYYLPRQWKGQVPKAVMHRRVLGRLTEAEQGLIPELPVSKLHNVLDAVGIGLHHVGRLKRKRNRAGTRRKPGR